MVFYKIKAFISTWNHQVLIIGALPTKITRIGVDDQRFQGSTRMRLKLGVELHVFI